MRSFRKASKEVPLAAAVELLDNDKYMRDFLLYGLHPFTRALPGTEAIQKDPEMVPFLRKVLVSGWSKDEQRTNTQLNSCYQNGWLHADMSPGEKKATFIFPTKLHLRYGFVITALDDC